MLRVHSSSAQEPSLQLQEEIYRTIESGPAKEKINQLFQNICGDNIQDITIQQKAEESRVTIDLKKSQYKRLENSHLYIPKKLEFYIDKEFITFVSDMGVNAPYEDMDTYCCILKHRFTWMMISLKENDFELVAPQWVGLFTPFCCGGTPTIRNLDAQRFIDITQQS